MAVRLAIKVVPRAARTEIAGWHGDRLRIRVAAAPEKGRANRAVEALLADVLRVQRSRVRVVAGLKSPSKVVEISDLAASEVEARLPPRDSAGSTA